MKEGITYQIAGPGRGKRGYVDFTPQAEGTYTFYVGKEEPVRVCHETPTCKAVVTTCPLFQHAAQYQLHAGELYEIELRPIPDGDTFTLHIAGAPSDEPGDGGGDGSGGGSGSGSGSGTPPGDDNIVRLSGPRVFEAGPTPYYLKSADLDNDRDFDLVVSTPDDADGLTTVDILRAAGDGTFAMVSQIKTSAPGETVVSDFNHDAIPDIVGVAFDGQGPLPNFYLQGLGALTYSQSTWTLTQDLRPRISDGDFDEDGMVDLLLTYSGEATTGPGGFLIVKVPRFVVISDEVSVDGHYTRQAIAGDFDGDGHQDVVESLGMPAVLRLYTGDGTGTVQFRTEYTLDAAAIGRVAAFDVNHDGFDDVITNGDHLWLGSAKGLSAPVALNAQGAGFAVGDFNHDGRADLAIGGRNASDNPEIAILLATQSGFQRAATLAVPTTSSYFFAGTDLAVGDFNSDGFDDLATITLGGVAVWVSTP